MARRMGKSSFTSFMITFSTNPSRLGCVPCSRNERAKNPNKAASLRLVRDERRSAAADLVPDSDFMRRLAHEAEADGDTDCRYRHRIEQGTERYSSRLRDRGAEKWHAAAKPAVA